MAYRIVIPTRNAMSINPCYGSILRAKEKTDRIIVVDDGVDWEPTGFRFDLADVKEGVGMVIPGIKPFVFARNINLGIAAAGDDDVILCNDDTRLLSDFGFGYLSTIANENPKYGIISAAITGAVGNTEQLAQPGTRLREAKHHTVVFVCVYLRRSILQQLATYEYKDPEAKAGFADPKWMDERFVNYGFCDDDMCERVRRLGFKLGVFDGCVVEHGVLPSSYRGHAGMMATDLKPNRDRFIEKWGFEPGRGPK